MIYEFELTNYITANSSWHYYITTASDTQLDTIVNQRQAAQRRYNVDHIFNDTLRRNVVTNTFVVWFLYTHTHYTVTTVNCRLAHVRTECYFQTNTSGIQEHKTKKSLFFIFIAYGQKINCNKIGRTYNTVTYSCIHTLQYTYYNKK